MDVTRWMTLAAVLGLAGCTTTGGGGGALAYVPTRCPIGADVELKIVNSRSHGDGVAAEYAWIERNLPGWTRDAQALMPGPGGPSYDVIYLVKGQEKKTVCFDISDFF